MMICELPTAKLLLLLSYRQTREKHFYESSARRLEYDDDVDREIMRDVINEIAERIDGTGE